MEKCWEWMIRPRLFLDVSFKVPCPDAQSVFEIFFFHVHLFLSTERAVQHDPGLLCPAKNI